MRGNSPARIRSGEKTEIVISESYLSTSSDLTQQDGRGIRQGNNFDEVGIYHYLTEETFDSYMSAMRS